MQLNFLPTQWIQAVIPVFKLRIEDADYWTIEGMRSQQFSIGIFIFMLIGIFVFIMIMLQFIKHNKSGSRLKKGEKIMLAWMVIGVISAVIFGATQLLHGRLF